jgi:tRNA U54 and U55 pseudouridine synthase Pus10
VNQEVKVEDPKEVLEKIMTREHLMSVESIMQKLQTLPRPLFSGLEIFTDEISKTNLVSLLNVTCSHENILVYGRYLKLSRSCSQTPWLVEGENSGAGVTSVQCEIAKGIKEFFQPANDEFYLHAAGREDIDVRMLGTGRPFIFEFVSPKKAISCKTIID